MEEQYGQAMATMLEIAATSAATAHRQLLHNGTHPDDIPEFEQLLRGEIEARFRAGEVSEETFARLVREYHEETMLEAA